MVEEEESYVVEEIVDIRTMGRENKVQYRVRWEGYPTGEGIWE